MPAERETCELLCLDLPKAEELRRQRRTVEALSRAAAASKALADPTRLAVAAALRGTDELCVCDLGWVVERSEKLVSHHLRILRSAGLVESRREGRMVLYKLNELGRDLLEAVLPVHEGAMR
jgi:DNA-binding transcriptional ArsR family regulator